MLTTTSRQTLVKLGGRRVGRRPNDDRLLHIQRPGDGVIGL
jgi:hypothetical protein